MIDIASWQYIWRRPIMRCRFSILLATWALVACALPLGTQPTPVANTPTAAPSIDPTRPAAPAATDISGRLPQPTPEAPADALDDPARIAAAAPAPRDQLALAEALKGIGGIPAVARTTPLDVKVGDVEKFWVADFTTNTNFQISAKLRYAGPVVLMYVDSAIEAQVDQAALEQSAKQFEQEIYPRDRALFGQELSPGVDGDPRLTILNTVLRGGVVGYFYSSSSVVKAVNRFSNERDMFMMSINSLPLGSDAYASTLAHEFQHMIEWNVARRSPAWFNEGMSTIAQDLNGFVSNSYPQSFLRDPDVQLTAWAASGGERLSHYGASQLFLRYFQEQYAGDQGLSELIKADAGDNLDAFVPIAARKRPDIKSFADLYADWAVANVLNDPSVGDGRYAYQLLPDRAIPSEPQLGETQATVSQFGTDYYGELNGPLKITFNGSDLVGLTSARPKDGRYMWWSNRGDDSVETLTREFDLSGVQRATLQFATWHELELNFDYAFVNVSIDGGKTWQALKGNTTTEQDPQGQNYANGITGVSGAPGIATDSGTRGQWIEEQMDLSPYAGKKILLRFWVVNDDSYNAAGMLLDDIRIPELNFIDGAEQDDPSWQAQGFVRTTGELPQTWALRLVRVKDGATRVEQVPVDAQGHAVVQLGDGERGVLAVIGTTRFTTEPATYSYTITTP
jgi:immune inhibitor A